MAEGQGFQVIRDYNYIILPVAGIRNELFHDVANPGFTRKVDN
jgi:hypothetical protein